MHAQILLYEGFGGYAPSTDLNTLNGGSGWTSAWTDGGDPDSIETEATGLTYSTLQTTAGGAVKSANAFVNANRQFNAVDQNGSIFFSLLYQNAASNNLNDRAFVLSQSSFGMERVRIRNNASGQLSVGIQSVAGSGFQEFFTTTGLTITNPVFIVGEYTSGTAADGFSIYFNPSDLTNVAGTAAESFTILESDPIFGGGFFSGLASVGMSSTNRPNQWDEIRLAYGAGATIDDVVPIIPEPSVVAAFALGVAFVIVVMIRRRRAVSAMNN